MSQPTRFSVIAIFFEMRREAARTLHTLSSAYQRGVDAEDFEIIAIDNGSILHGLDEELRRPLRTELSAGAPCARFKVAGRRAQRGRAAGEWRMGHSHHRRCADALARRLRLFFASGASLFHPFAYTIGMHLGPKVQNESMLAGYDQAAEDELLAEVDWKKNGYDLFTISSVALSSKRGFFSELTESNCFAMRRDDFVRMGGYDERFQLPGGGLANIDFFNRAMMDSRIEPVMLLGEASFHQFHFGVATNVPLDLHPISKFEEEYHNIRGHSYSSVHREPHYLGHASISCRRLFQF